MIEAKIHGFFKQRCEVALGGAPLTTMDFIRREGSTYQLQGEPYEISKDGRKEFALSSSGVLYATGTLARNKNWTISGSTGQFEVVKPKFFGQEWHVHAGGQQIGVIRKRSFFDRTMEAVIEPAMPLPAQVFAVYLVLVLLRRQQAAAASNSGS